MGQRTGCGIPRDQSMCSMGEHERRCPKWSKPGQNMTGTKTGSPAELWRASTKKTGRATIVVQGDRIHVAKSGVVDCFSWEGILVWSQQLPVMGTGRLALGFPGNVVQADDPGEK